MVHYRTILESLMTVLSVANFKLESPYYKQGDTVVYEGATDEQVRWGSNTDPRGILVQGESYVIRDVDVRSWHTKLTLYGINGRFNSVHFKTNGNENVQED